MDTYPTSAPGIGNGGTSRRAVLRGVATGAAAAAFLAARWSVQAVSPPAFTLDGATSGASGTLDIVVLYGEPDDPAAFEAYYASTHMPIALKIPLYRRLDVCKAVIDTDNSAPSFYRLARISYANEADMEASLASPEGQAALADIANFATGGVTATIVNDIQILDAAPAVTGLTHPATDPRTP